MKKFKNKVSRVRLSQFCSWRYISKPLITLILCGVYFLAPHKIGFLSPRSEDSTIINNILFPLFHANIFHLLCNLTCVWSLRPPYYILPACAISFLASFLPEFTIAYQFSIFNFQFSICELSLPIMGISGIIFAIIGVKFGAVRLWKQMWSRLWLFILITAFIPNVACLFHVYCLVLGYLYGSVRADISARINPQHP